MRASPADSHVRSSCVLMVYFCGKGMVWVCVYRGAKTMPVENSAQH